MIEVMLGFPTAIAFAAGWISSSPEMYERLGARQALSHAKLAYYERMSGWIVLAISLVSVLLQVAAIAYLRCLLASDRQDSQADEVV